MKNPYFSDTSIDYVYKADILAFKTSYSGILIIKKLADNHHRVVFTTKIGNTLFDFSLKGKHIQTNYIVKELDRKALITILRKDLFVLLKERVESNFQYKKDNSTLYKTMILGKTHFYCYKNENLSKITRIANGNPKVTFYLSKINDNIARAIKIVHKDFGLTITLKAI